MMRALLGNNCASGAGGTPFDPNNLSWTSGRKKNWWHINGSAGSLTTAGNGGGSVPGVGDAVGSILSGAASDGYTLSYGNALAILRADGVEMPQTSYWIKSLSGAGYIHSTGITIAACVRLPNGESLYQFNSFGGGDASPPTDTVGLSTQSGSGVNYLKAVLDAGTYLQSDVSGDDLTQFHRLIFSAVPVSGENMSCKLWWDGVEVASGTLASNAAWDRDLPYMLGRPFIWQSRLHAQQGFSSAGDLTNIDNFLRYGA